MVLLWNCIAHRDIRRAQGDLMASGTHHHQEQAFHTRHGPEADAKSPERTTSGGTVHTLEAIQTRPGAARGLVWGTSLTLASPSSFRTSPPLIA